MTVLLDARSVTKVFGKTRAIDGISLTVEDGEVVGLIGPNGAGKTTLLSLLSGLIAPTEGSITYDVAMAARRPLKSCMGFASPEMPMFDYLTGTEVMEACGAVHALPRDVTRSRTSELLALFDLGGVGDRYVYEYSQGTRQKLSLCAALLHDPTLVFLDEPFNGLDPTTSYRLTRLLPRLSAAGRAVVVSSHDLGLVRRVCNRVLILDAGAAVHTAELNSQESPPRCSASADDDQSLEALMWRVVGEPEERRLSWIVPGPWRAASCISPS
jgi:ABC-2 type transport system ATP-binding protein